MLLAAYGHVTYGHFMSTMRGQSTTVVALDAAAPEAPAKASVEASPLYGVAMLKIAMELKKQDAAPLDELISGVLARMHLDEGEFRQFLASHGGLLRSIATRRGY